MPLRWTRAEAHTEIAKGCLSYLLFRTPAQPLSGTLGIPSVPLQLDQTFPLLRYSALHWIHHLRNMISSRADSHYDNCNDSGTRTWSAISDVINLLSQFLSRRLVLMAWIEAYYTFTDSSRYDVEGLNEWAIWTKSHFAECNTCRNGCPYQDILDFSQDLINLHDEWSTTLFAHPYEIWGSITAFLSSRFLAKTTSTVVNELAPKPHNGNAPSNAPLCTISEVTSAGTELAVLSIWPSM